MFLIPLLVLGQASTSDLLSKLDSLAKERKVEELSKYLAPFEGRNPLDPIRNGGAYGTGRFGWRAVLLRMYNQSFVVFTTDLTSEDIGELLFQFDQNGKLVYVPEDYANGERIASHDITVRFDLAAEKAILKDTIELQFVDRATLMPMVRLGPNYRVSRITDAQGADVAFLQAGGIVCFPGLRSAEKLTLNYAAIVNKPQYAGSISEKEAMLTNDYWYPMVARLPAPYTLTVSVPKDWTPVGQGELVSQSEEGGLKKAMFKMDVPVTYYSFSAAPYKVVEGTAKGKKYTVWSNDLSPAQMALQNELYPPIVDFYQRFAPYPFSGWGAVVSRAYGGGALEAYSFATYGGGMPGEDSHETAHTWWGGMVDNTYLKSMWNESFADFCQGYYGRNVPIGNTDERRLAFIVTPETQDAYNKAPLSKASPFIGPAASAIGYGKGAYVLQMLEQEIGSDRMLKSMQEWIRVQPKTRGGEWEDFEAAVDRIKGNDDPWFFDQWVRKPGWVDFDLQDLKWANGRLIGKTVFKSEPYIIHGEVLIRDESGHDSFVTAILSDNKREKEQKFVIPCLAKPSIVSFDPWRRILRPIHEDETPVQLSSVLPKMKRFTDPAHPGYLKNVASSGAVERLPTDLDGTFVVGNPESVPEMRALCSRVGFEVSGNKLSWRGTQIDLSKGAAMAAVDLGGGKRCVIGLGETRVRPDFGRAKTVLVDDLGRFIRGETLPKTSGYLTFRGF
ncbi:MAG: M1 family metallopeptidase [Fimbriimonadales bacterium]